MICLLVSKSFTPLTSACPFVVIYWVHDAVVWWRRACRLLYYVLLMYLSIWIRALLLIILLDICCIYIRRGLSALVLNSFFTADSSDGYCTECSACEMHTLFNVRCIYVLCDVVMLQLRSHLYSFVRLDSSITSIDVPYMIVVQYLSYVPDQIMW